jgi:hypothetical protein
MTITPEAPRELQFVLESLDHKLEAASQMLSVNDFSLSTIEAILLAQSDIEKLSTRNEILNTVIRNLSLLKLIASRVLNNEGKKTPVTDYDFTLQEIKGKVMIWNPKEEPVQIGAFIPNQRHSFIEYSNQRKGKPFQESWTIVHINEVQQTGIYMTREYGDACWKVSTHLMINDTSQPRLSAIQALEKAVNDTESGALLSELLDLQVSE